MLSNDEGRFELRRKIFQQLKVVIDLIELNRSHELEVIVRPTPPYSAEAMQFRRAVFLETAKYFLQAPA